MIHSDIINKFFVSVSSHLSPLSSPESNPIIPPTECRDQSIDIDHSPEFVISLADVEQSLSNIKVHKAAGPDGVPNWFLRDSAPF